MNQVPGKNADFAKVFGPHALSATMGEYKINPDGTYEYHGMTASYRGISQDEVERKLSVFDAVGNVICVGVEGNTEVQREEPGAFSGAASSMAEVQPAANPAGDPAPTTDAHVKGAEQTDATDPDLDAARGPSAEDKQSLLERIEEAAGHVLVEVMDSAEAAASVIVEHPWAILVHVKDQIEARVTTLLAEGEEAKKRLTGDTTVAQSGGGQNTTGSATGTLASAGSDTVAGNEAGAGSKQP